ncbi:hypothetical protein ACQ0P2_01335 [Streptococcus canis]|uniref:hypothetical protein n=1 Tax=Streptococcus canis TaxID=1329 RepID=UPI004036E841
MISLLLLSALSYPKLDGLVLTLVQGKAVTIIGLNTILLLEQVNRLDIPIYLERGLPLEKDHVFAQATHGQVDLVIVSCALPFCYQKCYNGSMTMDFP